MPAVAAARRSVTGTSAAAAQTNDSKAKPRLNRSYSLTALNGPPGCCDSPLRMLRQPLLATVPEEKYLSADRRRESQDAGAVAHDAQLPAEAPPPIAPFELHAQTLKNLVSAGLDMKNETDHRTVVQPLMQRCGGTIEKLASLIHAPLVGGLRDPGDATARRNAFGENRLPEKELPTFLELCFEALEDETLRYLCVASLFSIILGTALGCAKKDWIEGFAIIVAVVVVVIVTAVNDYSKERQFAALSAVADDRKVLVYRNDSQQPVEVGVYHVMVGDLLYLRVGDKIPADCYFLSGSEVKCSESALTGESDDVKKGRLSFSDTGRLVSSPFFFGGTQIVQGSATAIVLAVGPNTISGSAAVLMQEVEPETGPMQSKLDNVAALIGKIGLVAAVVTFVVLMIRFGVSFAQKDSGYQTWQNVRHWREIVEFIVIAITVLVVAIPEGLPLAVTISLAFSVKKMMNDNNLVRNLNSCETMGSATTIRSDKTGTLTTNNMTVMRAYVCGKDFGGAGDAPRDACALPGDVLDRLFASVIFNCDAATSLYNEKGDRALTGNKTELALLKWVENMKADYRSFRKQKSGDISSRVEFPFSSDRKRMSAVLNSVEGWTVYTKGASEIVLSLCTHILMPDGAAVELSPSKRSEIEASVIKKYADDGLRTICIAYRPLAHSLHPPADAESVERDLIMVAVTGIEDPVRPEVPKAIELCRMAGIDVRMVTGDNIATARSIARKCGILAPGDTHLFAMEGPEFRAKVMNSDGSVNQEELDKIWPNLRVLARSSPMDKHTLVSGIMNSTACTVDQVVAVTGDGTNDAPALRKADVGFAMGIAGTEVAKEACDIIVMDDNFSSIVAAVKWGRGVYDNICKFIQFQSTVNVVAIISTVVGAAILKESPMRAIQLLWINLLMDSLASLALSTESPSDSLLNRQPYGRTKPLLSKMMCRNILFHSCYQIAVIFYFLYGIYNLVPGVECQRPDCDQNSEYELCDFGDQACLCSANSDPSVQYCMVFNVFVCMTLFNEINMRKLDSTRNVFRGILGNPVFWYVIVATCACQALIIQFGGAAFGTIPLTGLQWLACIAFGAGTLVWHQIILFIPCNWIPNGDDQDDGVTTQIRAPIRASSRRTNTQLLQLTAELSQLSMLSSGAGSRLQVSRSRRSKLARKGSRNQIVAQSVRSLQGSFRDISTRQETSDLKI